jgi:radical SAM superfamily enzyme YgiQ (UPF0313 family)
VDIAYIKTNNESGGYVVHGLGLLSAIGKKAGHSSHWSNPILGQPLPVGVDAVAITACSDAVPAALALANVYKQHDPETKVFVGGPHATFCPEDLEKGSFDYIVKGEGEKVWEEFCGGVLPKDRVIQGHGVDNLDDLPFVDRVQDRDYSILSEHPPAPLLRYPQPYRCVIAGRGCLYNCAFCKPGTDLIFGKKQIRRSVDNILDEIDTFDGLGSLFIHDDNLIEDEKWCEEFIAKWNGKPFLIQGRADNIVHREELLDKMHECGLVAMLIGFESGSDSRLRAMRKGNTRAINIKAAEICHNLNIDIQANMIFGTPGETMQDVRDSISLIKEHLMPCIVSPAVYTPYPGSDWGRICNEQGWNLAKDTFDYCRYIGGRKLREEAFGYTYDWLYKTLKDAGL